MSKPAVILLVEDSRMDVELTLDAFKEARLSNRIEVAYSGQQALDYLIGNDHFANRSQYPLPDLILLDLKMPGIDGFEVLKRLKGTPLIKRIPVVILTSSKEEGDRALSYDIGANSYLVKPVAFTGFIDVVRQIEDYWLTLNVGAPMTEISST
ncbi:MAG: two-component system response regulator [gamma proteobacterium symbiont of Ctena orbiculata]|uniref:Response regulator n=1 Tax=Candidatus Thiodiazotropha taylori TaxID=2792791 RepID=A0A944QSK0_9GAMM|nr:response regulator [Candidatus Thiodiazotropha taylori]PUB88311.1 MAG: two-component system response regulator [gamma proteobacterium symbiont of Ctena orbiculata]MBT2988112.1 response regulator [Candidatus Thiodiazotropha taylori]MBT2998476.1 response regulator [Candidatus Thiodiazotropha taylori]MBT3002146.1 response regulator [Candidatus Thiodiazotropha taylori]